MGHGTPDWGLTAGANTVYQLTDLGELAARLGSIVTHDRRGDVVALDDFGGGLGGWQIVLAGSGAAVGLSTDRARSTPFSARFTGGSSGARSAVLLKQLPFPAVSRFGHELSFNLPGTIDSLTALIYLYDGTNRVAGAVRWRDADNTLLYLNSAGVYTAFRTGVDLRASTRLFHTMKLVVDLSSQEYVRFILDDVETDLSDIGLYVTASAALPMLEVYISLISRSGQNDQAYVDDPIVTQNEPA